MWDRRVIKWVCIAVASVTLCVGIGILVRSFQEDKENTIEVEYSATHIPEAQGLGTLISQNFEGIQRLQITRSQKLKVNLYQLRTVVTTSDGERSVHDFTVRYSDKAYELIDEQNTLKSGYSPQAEVIVGAGYVE